ncbi:hypothetical protein TNCV_1670001 [Trichonephila clavipes]|nr:hypothetical protein TNCV_1670001 [Trichonephila clavipes]
MSDHRIFLRLHRQLLKTLSIHFTRHDAGGRGAVPSPSLEASILNVVADRLESSTRVVAYHVSVSHQTVCRVLNENRVHLFHFHRVQALNSADYLRLPVGGTTLCAVPGLHSSCAEQLQTITVNITLINGAFNKHVVFLFVSYFLCFDLTASLAPIHSYTIMIVRMHCTSSLLYHELGTTLFLSQQTVIFLSLHNSVSPVVHSDKHNGTKLDIKTNDGLGSKITRKETF